MPNNSTLPKTDNQNTYLSEEEESLSSGNKWLAIVVGVIFLLATIGYFLPEDGGRNAINGVMPSVMLGEASVTGAQPAKEEVPAEAKEAAAQEDTTPETEKLLVAKATPRRTAQPIVETSLDSRQLPAAEPVAEQVVEEAAPAVAASTAPTFYTLSGRILDENGRPLAGATVLLKGSRKGTGTDANGIYALEVPAGDNQLVFGYGGYQDQEVHTRGSQPVNVTLLPTEGGKRRRN